MCLPACLVSCVWPKQHTCEWVWVAVAPWLSGWLCARGQLCSEGRGLRKGRRHKRTSAI